MVMKKQESSERIATIDALRGLAIFGMILCAYIGWQSGLPAWMFHAQLPPPDYVFSPDVRGITWVDLVFPFFLFAMGAAFPLAMRKRLDTGTPAAKPVGQPAAPAAPEVKASAAVPETKVEPEKKSEE